MNKEVINRILSKISKEYRLAMLSLGTDAYVEEPLNERDRRLIKEHKEYQTKLLEEIWLLKGLLK